MQHLAVAPEAVGIAMLHVQSDVYICIHETKMGLNEGRLFYLGFKEQKQIFNIASYLIVFFSNIPH